MYDRTIANRTLNFEASGGLLDAALVMRDRETDSWWSIMKGASIGGPMEGRGLSELPAGEKAMWGEWRRRHPETRVLSVEGKSHVATNHYENHFTSERTFRNAKVSDERLAAKHPIFAFRLQSLAYAVAHETVAGGYLATAGDSSKAAPQVFLFREPGSSVFATTRAWLVPRGLIRSDAGGFVAEPRGRGRPKPVRLDSAASLERLAMIDGVSVLPGLDTYWYTWVAVNRETSLLR